MSDSIENSTEHCIDNLMLIDSTYDLVVPKHKNQIKKKVQIHAPLIQ